MMIEYIYELNFRYVHISCAPYCVRVKSCLRLLLLLLLNGKCYTCVSGHGMAKHGTAQYMQLTKALFVIILCKLYLFQRCFRNRHTLQNNSIKINHLTIALAFVKCFSLITHFSNIKKKRFFEHFHVPKIIHTIYSGDHFLISRYMQIDWALQFKCSGIRNQNFDLNYTRIWIFMRCSLKSNVVLVFELR